VRERHLFLLDQYAEVLGGIVPACLVGDTINENHGAMSRGESNPMQIDVMDFPARIPITEINWIGESGFDFVDFTLEMIDPDAVCTAPDR
jgi:hypothetical protein